VLWFALAGSGDNVVARPIDGNLTRGNWVRFAYSVLKLVTRRVVTCRFVLTCSRSLARGSFTDVTVDRRDYCGLLDACASLCEKDKTYVLGTEFVWW
jgi:hypothetical protein